MEEIRVKENLEKLLAVSSPIVDLYFELINRLKNGESYDNCFSIISKLKIRISMEETVLRSFSKDEIDEDTIEDYDGIKKIEFKSQSIEEMVRQRIDEYKGKNRKK